MYTRDPTIEALANRAGIVFDDAVAMLPRHRAKDGTWGPIDETGMRLAFDAVTANSYSQPTLVTTPNAGTLAMVSTFIDPKIVDVILAPVAAEEIYGSRKVGDRAMSTFGFPVLENTGQVSAYNDFMNSGVSGVNVNWPQRQSFNFQTNLEYGDLEVERFALSKINLVAQKQLSVVNTLLRFANLSYFYGITGLQNYGALNEPSLAPALTPATKAATGTSWANALPTEILADIQTGYAQLQAGTYGTGGNLDRNTKMTLAISPVTDAYMANTNSFGLTAAEMIKKAFPGITIKVAPQLQSGTTYSYQLIVDELLGQRTIECAFNERLHAHRIISDTSSFRQKQSAGSWGAVLYRPICIASMAGI